MQHIVKNMYYDALLSDEAKRTSGKPKSEAKSAVGKTCLVRIGKKTRKKLAIFVSAFHVT